MVDAGYHPGGIGDVEKAGLAEKAAAYTPVPGGVAPVLAQRVEMRGCGAELRIRQRYFPAPGFVCEFEQRARSRRE